MVSPGSHDTDPVHEGRPLRVVAWSTGTVGRHAIAGIDRHPGLELVGVWVSDPAKDGRDAGDLAGLGRDLEIRATSDRDALLALEPDAIVHTAMTDDRVFESIEDLVGFLEAGVNVVSSGPVLLQWPSGILPPEMLERIAKAGEAGNASLHVNGIDPGFANDVLPLSLTSLSQRIDEVRVQEIADYSTYFQPVVMRDIFGFGRPLEDTPMLWEPGVLSMAWGSVVRQIAAGLGITLDEPLTENVDRRPAERDVETASVDVRAGTMGAVRFEVIGTVDGVPRVVLEHVTRTAEDQVPEWPTPREGGGCYRVVITGEPEMELELAHRGEHGDHNVSGMIVTAQRLVNAVPAVVDAAPGLVTALDLPLVTGRGMVSTGDPGMNILDRFTLTDHVAIVTGAGRGIGAATAVALAEAGADVVISARTADQLEAVAARVSDAGRQALVVPADLSDLDAVAGLAQAAQDEFGRVDTVVNNVGGTIPNAFLDTDVDYLEEAFRFNVSTAHALSRAAVPFMLKGPDDAQKAIVTISSMMGRTAGRGYLAYGTAKAALAHWARLAARDLAPRIRVNGIAVGSVSTSALDFVTSDPGMRRQMEEKTPLGRVGEAEDIAAAVLYLSSRAGQYVTGKLLEVDGGIQEPNLDLGLPDLQSGT